MMIDKVHVHNKNKEIKKYKMKSSYLSNSLLRFYDTSKRVLPWRDNKIPYYIWISEIMLQQTRVEAVIPYFNRFIKALPTISHLAKVEEDSLLKLWEGLGYYNRARNLKKAAIKIENEFNGIMPQTKEELESLPGIGPYTSGALLSIAYEQQVAAVDGNVLRVFSRFYQIEEDIKNPKTKAVIKALVQDSLPQSRNGDYNQAIMELGATICIPNGRPLCELCPIKQECLSYKNNMQMILPFKSKKKPRIIEKKTIYIYKYKNLYAIRKRPDTGLLASMYEFVNVEGHIKEPLSKLPNSKHIFTHIEWNMIAYFEEVTTKNKDYIWATKEEIEHKYSIPNAFKKYKDYILKD
jgi:A/G-specific adenine glycosylase